MSSKTKIVVLHLKELIYTGIFVVLGILFVILLFIMFRSDKEENPTPAAPETEEGADTASPTYHSGVYKSAIYLEGDIVEIGLTIEEGQIASLTMEPLSDKITTLYPLLEPSFESISAQVCESQSLDDIVYDQEASYTSELLLEVIGDTLDKVQVEP